jgi:hypothetical protein
MARKKKETMDQFVKRRGKETGKVTIPESQDQPLSAGRHPLLALQMQKGIVKKKTAKKMEKWAHTKKVREHEGKAF